MIVLIHVLAALGSITYTTYLIFSPSAFKLRIAYGFMAGTLLSGSYLAIAGSSSLLRTCITGLVYISLVSVGLVLAQKKLVRINS